MSIYLGTCQEFQIEVQEINKSLLEIANRPITVNNQISLVGHRLEKKAVELLDEIIGRIKDEKLKAEIGEVRKDIKATIKDQKARNNIVQFFTRLGDKNSDLHKTISGVGYNDPQKLDQNIFFLRWNFSRLKSVIFSILSKLI